MIIFKCGLSVQTLWEPM